MAVLLLYVAVLLTSLIGRSECICPSGFYSHAEKCYYASTQEATWAGAMQACQTMGGTLATIDDQDTQIFLAGLADVLDKDRSVTYHTRNDYVYHYLHDLGVDVTDHKSVVFSVKACHDAHVALSTNKNNDTHNTYEIVIGGWSDSQSVIRDCKQCSHMDEVHHKSHPLSCTDLRPFWVSWSNNVIRVGTGNDVGVSQFMTWTDPSPHAVNYVAIATGFGNEGDWSFPLNTYMPGKFWVGATDQQTKGEWLWQPEELLIQGFSEWAPGEPNTSAGNCMALDMQHRMQWRADTCAEMRNYICEKADEGLTDILG